MTYLQLGKDLNELLNVEDRFRSVTVEDLDKFIEKYLNVHAVKTFVLLPELE